MGGWNAIVARAVALIGVEPVYLQIAIFLAIAFFAVMIIEGLRLTFTPRRTLIRYLQLHAPDDADSAQPFSQDYEASDFGEPAMVMAAPDARPAVYRSAGSLRPTIRRAPRDLHETSRDDAT